MTTGCVGHSGTSTYCDRCLNEIVFDIPIHKNEI